MPECPSATLRRVSNFDTEVCSWLFASWPQKAELAGRSPLKSDFFTDAADCVSSPEPEHIFLDDKQEVAVTA
jgi:hypothetical protein